MCNQMGGVGDSADFGPAKAFADEHDVFSFDKVRTAGVQKQGRFFEAVCRHDGFSRLIVVCDDRIEGDGSVKAAVAIPREILD